MYKPKPTVCYKCYNKVMKTVAHRELRNNSAAVLRAVQAGESFEVTNNGEVVAVLSPPSTVALQGVRFRPRLAHTRFSDLPKITTTKSVQRILDDLRSDR